MSKLAVIYWSGTGNTKAMAEAVAEGAKGAGAAASYDKLALGCSAMGDEVLEEAEFEPFFQQLESRLTGKNISLFGSYGWGDGQWMRDWAQRADDDGAFLCGEPLIVNEAPDADGLEQCRALGAGLANA